MDAFGTRGYDGTSLDDLARELGIRKQTILYWFPSKEALLEAVVDRCADEVTRRLVRGARAAPGDGFGRVEAMVRAMFRLAARHPSMLGFLREVTRLGPPASTRLLDRLEPLIDRASAFLEAEMDAGPHAPPRSAPAAPGRLLDGHRHGDGGRGAARLRRGADAPVAAASPGRAPVAAAGRARTVTERGRPVSPVARLTLRERAYQAKDAGALIRGPYMVAWPPGSEWRNRPRTNLGPTGARKGSSMAIKKLGKAAAALALVVGLTAAMAGAAPRRRP